MGEVKKSKGWEEGKKKGKKKDQGVALKLLLQVLPRVLVLPIFYIFSIYMFPCRAPLFHLRGGDGGFVSTVLKHNMLLLGGGHDLSMVISQRFPHTMQVSSVNLTQCKVASFTPYMCFSSFMSKKSA